MYFILGSIFASFFLVISKEWSYQNISWSRRSKCDRCSYPLSIIDLIPIISYLWSRGSCRYCKGRIAFTYIFFELIAGIYFLMIAKFYSAEDTIYILVISSILTMMSLIDIHALWVPDLLQVFLLITIIIQGPDLTQYIYSLFIFTLFILVYYLSNKGFGVADIKLITTLSISLSPIFFPIFLFLASTLGLSYLGVLWLKKQDIKNYPLPFVPFISLSYIIIYLNQ